MALIDADLRRPSLAECMGLEGEVGLTTVLIGQVDVQDAIQPWGKSNLYVLPSGQVPPNPSELLGSRSMTNLLETLASQYDMVLIDTPPLLPVTDAAILATITDADASRPGSAVGAQWQAPAGDHDKQTNLHLRQPLAWLPTRHRSPESVSANRLL